MVLRIVLGGLFVAMAAGQLVSFAQMPGILAAYGLVSGVGATALAVALIAGELVCGVWFLARPRSRARVPVWVFTGVAVVWALLAAQAYARGLTVANCGCFGRFLPQRLSWFVLVQDGLLLLYAGLLLRGSAGRRGQCSHPGRAAQRGGGRVMTGRPEHSVADHCRSRDGTSSVYLRKRCREHGQFEALVYGDAEEYLASARFNKPGTIPLAFQTEVTHGRVPPYSQCVGGVSGAVRVG